MNDADFQEAQLKAQSKAAVRFLTDHGIQPFVWVDGTKERIVDVVDAMIVTESGRTGPVPSRGQGIDAWRESTIKTGQETFKFRALKTYGAA